MIGSRAVLTLSSLCPLCLWGSTVFAQGPPLREVIDAEVRAAWAREKITPAPPATDAEFLRRVSLDLAGSVPTHDETVAFLDSKDAAKREQLIDRLLADPRYARHQADVSAPDDRNFHPLRFLPRSKPLTLAQPPKDRQFIEM